MTDAELKEATGGTVNNTITNPWGMGIDKTNATITVNTVVSNTDNTKKCRGK